MKTAKKLLAVLLAALMAMSVMGVASFAADAESESNNAYTEADAITSGTEIAGTLSATSDVDWYSFTATKAGNATISLAHTASASEYVYFYVRVYDSADDAATSTDAVATVESKGTDASKDATIAVAKDATYYIAVSTANASAVNVAYTLKADDGTTGGSTTPTPSLPATGDKESEDNGSFTAADKITAETAMNGALADKDDDDYFYVKLEEDALVDIEFSFEQQAGQTSTYFEVSLYDSSKSLVSSVKAQGYKGLAEITDIELEAGKFYVVVTSGAKASTVPYQVVVNLSEIPTYSVESENNNTDDTADALVLGRPMYGDLTNDGDGNDDTVDWYSFNVTKKGIVSVSFSHDVNKGSHADETFFKVVVYDDEGSSVLSLDSKGNQETVTAPRQLLDKGEYTVRVKNGEYLSDLRYSLSVNVLPFEEYETDENNDEYTGAMELDLDKASNNKYQSGLYIGDLSAETDVDFYKFLVDDAGYIRVEFNNEMASSNDTVYTIGIYTTSTGSGEVKLDNIHEVEIDGNAYTSPAIGLDGDDDMYYYLKVESDDYEKDGAYSVAVTYTVSSYTETEANNNSGTADAMTTDAAILGSTFDKDDEDWFKFEYNNSKYCEIKAATPVKAEKESAEWTVYVYDKSLNQVAKFDFTNDEEGTFTLDENLKSGTYYIKVVADNNDFSSEDYQITLATTKNENTMSFIDRIKAIDWSTFLKNFDFLKTVDWGQALKLLGNAIKSIGVLLAAVFNK